MELQPGIYQDKSEDFHLKEFEALRREIEVTLKDARTHEVYMVVAIGGIWVWLYDKNLPPLTWFVPCILAVLGAMRAFGINKSFDVFHDYILKMEKAFSKEGAPGGWEHFIARRDTGFTRASATFWGLLILSSFVFAGLRLFKIA